MLRIDLPMESVEDYCRRWRIKEMAVFGSAVRDDFTPGSDIDVLITFNASAAWTIFDHVDMQEELEHIFNRKVDLLVRAGIEKSSNYIRRQEILESAEVIYASA